MTNANETADRFFESYAAALLARDEKAIATMYAVPSLILFPASPLPSAMPGRPRPFFASSWGQYEGIDSMDRQVVIMAEAPGSIWADVTWSYQGEARERFCYQLIETQAGWQIGVLTPMPKP